MIKLLRTFILHIIPPSGWKPAIIFMLGILCGLLVFLVYISKAPSYLSDNPKTCINCHIMVPQYATWSHSAHGRETHCNDCHIPHNNIFNTYYFKATDGLRHAAIFTLRGEAQVIKIGDDGKKAVQMNCIRCHEYLVTDSRTLAYTRSFHQYRKDHYCWECHRETPHGRVSSLSATPNARAPLPSSPVPDWLKKLIINEKQKIQ